MKDVHLELTTDNKWLAVDVYQDWAAVFLCEGQYRDLDGIIKSSIISILAD